MGWALLWAIFWLLPAAQRPTRAEDSPRQSPRYTLRYRFHPGQTLRWKVVHRARIKTTIGGTTQTAETVSQSVKVWRVKEVDSQGAATFDHLVESVDMRQQVSGRQEVRYNSQTDEAPPPGFERIAQSVGVPVTTFTLTPQGEILRRTPHSVAAAAAPEQHGLITIPLPEKPVAVGESWSLPFQIDVPLQDGTIKKVKTSQKFTLAEVDAGVARIDVANQILTPVRDPAVEAQLIQRVFTGTVRFDIEAGRVIGQQMDVDKVVVGFQGETSSLHYLSRFTEDFLGEEPQTASRPTRSE